MRKHTSRVVIVLVVVMTAFLTISAVRALGSFMDSMEEKTQTRIESLTY